MAASGSAARTPIALSIAGSDSSGGAGIQADLKTFSAFGVYGATAITALTAQNTRGVQAVEAVAPAFVARQIQSVLDDLDVGAIKIGMLANAGVIAAVADAIATYKGPVILDPVMVATSGDALLAADAVGALKSRLLPRATLITPNLPEAARLLDMRIAADEAEARIQLAALGGLGARAVLLKGGHGTGAEAVDLLLALAQVTRHASPRLASRNTHGTGCTLSAAIAALLASGVGLAEAVARAKAYVHYAIAAGAHLGVGGGHGPVDHLFAIRRGPLPA